MDEIQKVLVEAGRKDLAQKYYEKVAGETKEAIFYKKLKELKYWKSRNTEVFAQCDSLQKAKKIIENSKVDQKLKVASKEKVAESYKNTYGDEIYELAVKKRVESIMKNKTKFKNIKYLVDKKFDKKAVEQYVREDDTFADQIDNMRYMWDKLIKSGPLE